MSKAAELAALIGSQSALSHRNIIINGAMQVAQRGTSVSGLGGSNDVFAALDRIKYFVGNTAGRFTAEQVAVTDLPGFANAMKLSCTTADTSIAADEFMGFKHMIEGQDVQQLKKGTSEAKSTTLSFYVKGNAAAEYTVEIRDIDNDRINTQIFNVTTSWTRVEMTFAPDTTGAYDDDNAMSIQMSWWLHAGSTYNGGTFASNSWASRTQGNRVKSSNSSFFDSTSRTLFITGIQYEVGEQATPFEHRSFGDELLRCQRYFAKASGEDNNSRCLGHGSYRDSSKFRVIVRVPVVMRADPSLVEKSPGSQAYRGNHSGGNETNDGSTAATLDNTGQPVLTLNVGGFSGLSSTDNGLIKVEGSGNWVALDAEL
jgi:hypothetical protein